MGGGAGGLIQCPTCERSFNEKALEKHQKICVKVFQNKRKAFDMKDQRKATDASGKGMESEGGIGGRINNYKPKPPRGRGIRKEQSQDTPVEAGGQKKIPKWKL